MITLIIALVIIGAFIASLVYEFRHPGDATTPDEDGSKNNDNID